MTTAGRYLKRKRTYNIVVYDSTDTKAQPPLDDIKWPKWMTDALGMEPAALTFWWKLGTAMQSLKGNADCVIPASSWQIALEGTRAALLDNSRKANLPPTLEFWGHGRAGGSYIAGEKLAVKTIEEKSNKTKELLYDCRKFFNPDESWVWFRNCSVFYGQKGYDFAKTFRDFLVCPIVAHTFLITFWQPGEHCLEIGEVPNWPLDEGGETEETGMPSLNPLSPNMILAPQFFPILRW